MTAPLALRATGLLRVFHEAGVLGLADVHVALRVGRLSGEGDERVLLALALTVQAVRAGSVCLEPLVAASAEYEAVGDHVDVAELPWPEPLAWLAAIEASPLVTLGPSGPGLRPLRLVGERLYLERHWGQEEELAAQLRSRAAAPPPKPDVDVLSDELDALFGQAAHDDRQRVACARAAQAWVTVIAGGPGTGKTTTIVRLLALLTRLGVPPERIALAAPTGKAAARMEAAIATALAGLPDADARALSDIKASTIHRLLGWRPDAHTRFLHEKDDPLPHDVIVVDEMSMVSLQLMVRLLDAVRPNARIVLVGDPDQLASVEAGTVMADITRAPGARDVVVLDRNWRFGGSIDSLAAAVRDGDWATALDLLGSGDDAVALCSPDEVATRERLAHRLARQGATLIDRARAGDAEGALRALDSHRLLCAHRNGPYGVARWSRRAESIVAAAVPGYGREGEWYIGRPLIVNRNAAHLGLYNGDTGVVIETADGPRAVFGSGSFRPWLLEDVATVLALTIHRAQGSQFEAVSVVLPPPTSPLLTRELLYTGITRATSRVELIGTPESVRRAIERPARRASGLADRLWVPPPADPTL